MKFLGPEFPNSVLNSYLHYSLENYLVAMVAGNRKGKLDIEHNLLKIKQTLIKWMKKMFSISETNLNTVSSFHT